MADFDLNSILGSLSAEDMENLKKTASELLGNMSASTEREKQNNEGNKNPEKNWDNTQNILNGLGSLGMPDLSQLSALAPVLQAVNGNDERVEFINALRPLLSDSRKKKADEAMKLVRLLSLIPLLQERGIM